MAALAIVSVLSCSKKDDDKPTPPVPPTPPTQLKTVARDEGGYLYCTPTEIPQVLL